MILAGYGIDLGTSNCLVARMDQDFDDNFELRILPDSEGNTSFPSVISYTDSNSYIAGEAALDRMTDFPDSTVELIKVRLGKSKGIPIKVNDTAFEKSPQEITSLLLQHLNLSRKGRVKTPVITVPAFFDQSQKDATMQASELATMKPLQLIEEPTAAVVYQIYSDYQKLGAEKYINQFNNKNILVFDFGGGTLDLSLIHIAFREGAVQPEVLAVGGDNNLGGNLIDFFFEKVMLEQYLMHVYKTDSFIKSVTQAFTEYLDNYLTKGKLVFSSGVSDEVKNYIFKLKRELERVKKELSSKESSVISFPGDYKPLTFSRKNFENAVLQHNDLDLGERIHSALEDIARKEKNVDQVLLVGGSSQIPFVTEVILNTFAELGLHKNAIKISDDHMGAVAKGAAIQAALIQGNSIPPFRKNRCTSVVSRDILIQVGNTPELFVSSGTKYPFEQPKIKTMAIPHALATNVVLRLYEKIQTAGNAENKLICSYPYYLPIYYTGDEIKLSMNIDEAGLYQVTAIHIPTNERVVFEPQKEYALNTEEMKKASKSVSNMKDQS